MITFLMSMAILILGYVIYGRVVENIFGVDSSRTVPSKRMKDGIDYIEMSLPKAFLIQFLNIAGTGPIFGAVAGALWGPAAFMWIVFGSIFAGAVQDYLTGMISLRHDGASVTEIIGRYLGDGVKRITLVLALILLVLIGTVLVTSPADILQNMTGVDRKIWIALIMGYFLIATVLPMDKVIGKIYPVFGLCLLLMAVGILGGMVVTGKITEIPELSFSNPHPKGVTMFPFLFISIACGAISGFHSTQSPMIARCIQSERDGRKVFYGSMIAEGMVALIWAAIAMCFFGGTQGLAEAGSAAVVVNKVSIEMLGRVGGILALLGVVACPITTGDTAFRSARLMIADFCKIDQTSIAKRFLIATPLFGIAVLLTSMDFTIIWRYSAWANQALAVFPLWAASIYLAQNGKNYMISMVPAMFMTVVTSTYILHAKEGLQLSLEIASVMGMSCTICITVWFVVKLRQSKILKIQEN